MPDEVTYDYRDYTTEQLENAAHGQSTTMAASVAIALLEAHPDVDTQSTMARLVQDDSVDVRARRSAARVLATFPEAAPVLQTLVDSPDERLSDIARGALHHQD